MNKGETVMVFDLERYIDEPIVYFDDTKKIDDQKLFLLGVRIRSDMVDLLLNGVKAEDITVKKLKHFKGNIMPSICMALAIGGCVGNMVDRFMTVFHLREGVIDFVGMYIFNYGWPIYNVADIALVLGIVLFAIWALFFDKNDKINKSVEDGDDNA
jgi:hypothetical protein